MTYLAVQQVPKRCYCGILPLPRYDIPARQGNYYRRGFYPDRNKRHSSDNISVNLLYQIIVGFNVSGEKGTETIFSSSHLPKEIKSRFPEATSLGKKNIGSEELRKVIILLFSYVYWFNIQCSDEDLNYNDYEDQLNDLLLNCGFSNMYYGNPYDWLFMYCTVLGSNPENRMLPLDTFREIIEEALETE